MKIISFAVLIQFLFLVSFKLSSLLHETVCQIKNQRKIHRKLFQYIYQKKEIDQLRALNCKRPLGIIKMKNKITILNGAEIKHYVFSKI